MWKNGYRLSKIRARLLKEGVAVSKTSLCLNIRKYKLTGLVADRRTHKPLKKLNDAHYRFIDNAMAENDEHPSYTLRSIHTYAYAHVKA